MSTGIPGHGDLLAHPLPGLLFRIHRREMTGTLSVGAGRNERRVFMRKGNVVAVSSPASIEACARILLEQGIVSQDSYAWSLLRAQETGEKQTDLLADAGVVSEEEVAKARRQQSFEAMMRLFRVRSAEFSSREHDHEKGRHADAADLGLTMRGIIYLGIRGGYDLDRLREEMAATFDRSTFRIGADGVRHLDDYELEDQARLIAARLCEDDCTLEMLGDDELIARRVVYALSATDALEMTIDVMAPEAPRPVATPAPLTDVEGAGSYRFVRRTVPPQARRERFPTTKNKN